MTIAFTIPGTRDEFLARLATMDRELNYLYNYISSLDAMDTEGMEALNMAIHETMVMDDAAMTAPDIGSAAMDKFMLAIERAIIALGRLTPGSEQSRVLNLTRDFMYFQNLCRLLSEVANRGITPGPQLPSPVAFGIEQGRLTVASITGVETSENKAAALAALQKRATDLLAEFELSNLDRRLVAETQNLVTATSSRNIVEMGLAFTGFFTTVSFHDEEMSRPLLGQISALKQIADLYLGQFDDWLEFISKANSAIYTPEVRAELIQSSRKTVEALSGAGQLVSPQVALAIEAVTDPVWGSNTPSPRHTFALVRTLENFVAKASELFLIAVKKVGGKASEKVVEVVADAAVVVMVGAILHAAIALSHLPIGEATWIRQAVPVLESFRASLKAKD